MDDIIVEYVNYVSQVHKSIKRMIKDTSLIIEIINLIKHVVEEE